MKKIAWISVVVILAITCMGMLTACYPSKPAKLDKVVGTYRLQTFTRTYTKQNENTGENESDVRDMMATEGIEAYLVLRADNTGYYIYRSNTVALTARSVRVNYSYDDEEPDKVKQLTYDVGLTTTGDARPGRWHETLGVYFKRKEKVLTFTLPAIKLGALSREYSQTVRYERVDNATDLQYVQKAIGETLAVPPYEVAPLDGVHVYSGVYDDASPYVYTILDLHAGTGKADVYYAAKATGQSEVRRNVAVTFDIPAVPTDGANGVQIVIHVGDDVYYSQYYSTPVSSLYARDGETERWFAAYARDGFDIEAQIATEMQQYAARQASEGNQE